MKKVSSEQVQEVLMEAAGALRKLASERDHYKQRAESYERRDEAVKVATAMHEKGIDTDTDFGDLVERLEKHAAEGTLAKIAAAVDLVGPDMGAKIAAISDDITHSGGLNNFERIILGGG